MLKVHITPEVEAEAAALLGSGEAARRWVKGIKAKAEAELAEALKDQVAVSIDNAKNPLNLVNGLGQCQFRMAASLHRWLLRWGNKEYVYDEAFIAKLIKDNPHLLFRPSVAKKAMIVKPEMPSNAGSCGDLNGKEAAA